MKKNKFYLKKIGRQGEISIWLVNGNQIRNELDKEFTNFGQHYRFSFIPEQEFWLDQEASPDEQNFFIDHLLIEWKLMKNGLPYFLATTLANIKEHSERLKSKDWKKATLKNKRSLIENIHLRLLKKLKNNLMVWLVDGKLIRDLYDIEFTEGGHDLVYKYIPQNEIWIDNDILAQERLYIALHEIYERKKMAKKICYSQAHQLASRIEWQARLDKNKLKQNLEKLGWQ
ncbi:MAG: hypothetical protein A3J62_03205 [Candidatus Buchananbacteria bacterium RIFCSPHIGHO2_02_FULL_38_8]|uniref:Uncharacterized protein n=2 Tax=Candidatus Buchananiibacteriota TaxID=1817903 RepID=A0A1G1XTR0_9BACT|nr:MAG: hypothetical protein A2731_00630 [Candidatus Buchananbacteria bacterium RIFCSPHIGHO2_01_FULL_39_8]OGY47183.1 MAG: hypothetical protein A3J62_03205 [Candidatus Buchananbacteria bacterium RIFCSPHIGHO2_02_FULL_38_8]